MKEDMQWHFREEELKKSDKKERDINKNSDCFIKTNMKCLKEDLSIRM